MLVLESWLREFVNPELDAQGIADTLTMAGLEVESLRTVAPPFTGVVVADIVSIAPHPNADKLRICQVNAGGQLLQIVCGAPNAAAGLKVPLATVGAVLPNGMRISKGKLRGELSFGMLCSAKELGMAQDSQGLWVLDATLPAGQDLREALNLDDHIFEIKLTPNRADCLSVYGVARELAALTNAPLQDKSLPTPAVTIADCLPVQVQAPDLCGRFTGRVIRGVNAKVPTPVHIRERLEKVGQRSISILVDLSNYVLLERGQPNHIFDLAKIGDGLQVRWAQDGEQLSLLNEQTIALQSNAGLVANTQTPLSLAGIMGGQSSAVSDDTQDVYVEMAFWHPDAIAGRSKAYKAFSESAYRFERGVDFAALPQALDYLTALILQYCGGQVGPIDDHRVALPTRHPVRMRVARCQKVLGIAVSASEIAQFFTQLGFEFTQDEQTFIVTPPSYRFDIAIEEDLIEEVARLYGFDRIPSHPPVAQAVMLSTQESKRSEHRLRELMALQGYQEVVNFSFVDKAWETQLLGNPDPIALLNPLASGLAVMRSSLLPGLLANVAYNAKRQRTDVSVFELGRVFRRDAQVANTHDTVAHVAQPLHLAGVRWGLAEPEQWGVSKRTVDFFDVKRNVQNLYGAQAKDLRFVPAEHPALHPGRCAEIWLGEDYQGLIGELHPQWLNTFDLSTPAVLFELQLSQLSQRVLPAVRPLSPHPQVHRDIAIWAPLTLSVQTLIDAVWVAKRSDPALVILHSVQLFDIWEDPKSDNAQRSLAFRLVLQSDTQTLEEAQIEAAVNAVRHCWLSQFDVRQR